MKRPLSVTLLALGVLSFTGANFLRFVESIRQWPLLSSLPLEISPIYIGLTGLLWTLAGLPILWGLWRGRPWASLGLRILVVVFAVFFWIDRLLVVNFPGERVNWPFLLITNLVVWFIAFWVLTRKPVKQFFGDMHDRQSENSTSA